MFGVYCEVELLVIYNLKNNIGFIMSENIFREMAIDKISKQIKSIISSVAPLLKIENGIPIIQGTCSFVKFESQKFILTAKHVLEDYDNQLYINLEYNTHKNIWSRLFDGAANFKHALIFLVVNYINRKEIYNKKGIKL